MPAISIIVPVYNTEKYLSRCIDSVINQTFTDFEVLLIDDGSTDNSGKICDEYAEKDSRIKVIHKENGGQAEARNLALDIAKGDYIAFVDSDDYISKYYLHILYDNIKKYDADISVCVCEKFTDILPTETTTQTHPETYSGKEFTTRCLLDKIPMKPWILCDKLWHRDCFSEIRMPIGRIYEDNAIVYKILYNAKKIVDCNNKLYFYFQRPESTVNQPFSIKHLDWLFVLNEMSIFFKELNDNTLYKKTIEMYISAIVNASHNVQKYVGDKSVVKKLRNNLKVQTTIAKQLFPVTIETHPQVYEIISPIYSKIYWTAQNIKNKLKRG